MASVASIFVSRFDAVIDPLLDAIGSPEAKRLRGRIALANARRIYRRFMEIFHGERFLDLRRRGARCTATRQRRRSRPMTKLAHERQYPARTDRDAGSQ